MQKRTVLLSWATVSAVFWALNYNYPSKFLLRGFYTFAALAVIYFASRLVFEEIVAKRIKDSKTKYSFRKTVSILYIAVFLVVLTRIWVESTQTLLVAYGLIGAALAVSLQDIVKNFAGGMIIFLTGIYRVGGRRAAYRQIDGDSKQLYQGPQLPLGRDKHPHNVRQRLEGSAGAYFRDSKKRDGKDNKAGHRGDIETGGEILHTKKVIEPAIFLTLTDSWINFNIRFTTEIRTRRALRSRLSRIILEEVQKSKNIKIASESLISTFQGFPR